MIGDVFTLWLEDRWDELLGYERRSIIPIQKEIARFIASLRRGAIDTRGLPIANYLCSLQFIDHAGCWRGPWSFMNDHEWKVVARITELECWERDAQWWNLQ